MKRFLTLFVAITLGLGSSKLSAQSNIAYNSNGYMICYYAEELGCSDGETDDMKSYDQILHEKYPEAKMTGFSLEQGEAIIYFYINPSYKDKYFQKQRLEMEEEEKEWENDEETRLYEEKMRVEEEANRKDVDNTFKTEGYIIVNGKKYKIPREVEEHCKEVKAYRAGNFIRYNYHTLDLETGEFKRGFWERITFDLFNSH